MAVSLPALLKAAGDPTRLRILNLLSRGTICVCELQRVLGLTQSMASRHLAVLRHAGLVSDQRRGNRVMYRLNGSQSQLYRVFLDFLGVCFQKDPDMIADVRALDSMIQHGQCAVAEPNPRQETVAP